MFPRMCPLVNNPLSHVVSFHQHRIDGTRMLIDIGLLTIQKEGFEEEVFDVLLEKLYEEPFLVRAKLLGAVPFMVAVGFPEHNAKATSPPSYFSTPLGKYQCNDTSIDFFFKQPFF